MLRYLVRRFMYMLFTVWVVTLISFAIIQLPPGDYVTTLVSNLNRTSQRPISPEYQQQLREMYGLDQPAYVQYFKWLRNIVIRGDFGYSFVYFRDAKDLITER